MSSAAKIVSLHINAMVKPAMGREPALMLAGDPPDLRERRRIREDPLSHRIIEKRRRDRMNSCLADLSRLIPHEYMKKGRGRVEKTEIIEMAIRRIKHLMSHAPCQEAECRADDMDTTTGPSIGDGVQRGSPSQPPSNEGQCSPNVDSLAESYRLGFAECLNETVHFLVQVEGLMVADPLCTRLRSHLTNHCDNILQNEPLRSRICCPNGLPDEKPSLANLSTPPPPVHTANSLPQQEVPEHMDPSGRLHDLSYSTSNNSLRMHQNHQPPQACGACTQHESSSDASTGGHTNTLSPTSWNSEKPMDDSSLPAPPSYKFKHRIQKRFERTEMVGGSDNRLTAHGIVTQSTLVPIFALAPSGCHYYASWIEAGAIPSYLACAAESSRNNSRWLSAHSVTISVDFSLSRASS